jgi:hypothetical protein
MQNTFRPRLRWLAILNVMLIAFPVSAQWMPMVSPRGLKLSSELEGAYQSNGISLSPTKTMCASQNGSALVVFDWETSTWSECGLLPEFIRQLNSPPRAIWSLRSGVAFVGYRYRTGFDGNDNYMLWVRTDDFGATWKELRLNEHPFRMYFDFKILDDGAIVGIQRDDVNSSDSLPDSLYLSRDLGETWTAYACATDTVQEVRISAHGVIETRYRNKIFRASVAALEWAEVESFSIPRALTRADSVTTYGIDNSIAPSLLLRSNDGERTWQPVLAQTPDNELATGRDVWIMGCTADVLLIRFIPANTGSAKWIISSDGGSTFSFLPDSLGYPTRARFEAKDRLYIVARRVVDGFDREFLFRSSDWGTTWQVVDIFDIGYLLHFSAKGDDIVIGTRAGKASRGTYGGESSNIRWNDASNGLPERVVSQISALHVQNKELLLASSGVNSTLETYVDDPDGDWKVLVDDVTAYCADGLEGLLVVNGTKSNPISSIPYDGVRIPRPYLHFVAALIPQRDVLYAGAGYAAGGSLTLIAYSTHVAAWNKVTWGSGRGIGADHFTPVSRNDGGTLVFNAGEQVVSMTGDSTKRPWGGLFVISPSHDILVDSTVVPFNSQQWVFDAVAVDGDSVVVAVGARTYHQGGSATSTSAGTFWKGSMQTLRFHQVFDGRSDKGHSYARGWQYAKDSSGTLFASADFGGVLWSTDNGNSWLELDYEVTSQWQVLDICVYNGQLIVATNKGLYRRDLPSSVNGGDNDGIYLVQVHPKPQPANTTLHLTIEGLDVIKSLRWTVQVVDVTGKVKKDLTEDLRKQAGTEPYTLDLDVSNWTSGFYLIGVNAQQYSRSFSVVVAR